MPAPASRYDFGIKKACTKTELLSELTHVHSSCTLSGVGEFFFVHSSKPDGSPSGNVYLKFYDSELGVLHSSQSCCFNHGEEEEEEGGDSEERIEALAMNPHTFLIKADSWRGLCLLDATWKKATYSPIEDADFLRMASFFNGGGPATEVHRTGLARIRNGTPGDFWLKSNDGGTIDVHKTVLYPLWPFFAATVDSNMKESTNNSISLPFPTSTVEVLVRYLYGESLEMEFDDAANLLIMAQMYDLPELLSLAVSRTKCGTMDARQALLLWKKSFEANNEEMRSHSTAKIKLIMPNISDSKLLDDLNREELVSLFMDVSMN